MRWAGEAAKSTVNAGKMNSPYDAVSAGSRMTLEAMRQLLKGGVGAIGYVTRSAISTTLGWGKDFAKLGLVAALSVPIIPGVEQTPWQMGKRTLETWDPKKALNTLEQGTSLQQMIAQRMSAAQEATKPLREGLPPDRSPT